MITAAVVTISDRGATGEREDVSGKVLQELVSELPAKVVCYEVVPDERETIKELFGDLADRRGVDLVISTGGTGPAPRDVTPEATLEVIDKEIPGLTELMRFEGYKKTPFAVLSRARAGIRKQTLIINLPGNPRAVQESMEILAPLIPAVVALVKGEEPIDGICEAS